MLAISDHEKGLLYSSSRYYNNSVWRESGICLRYILDGVDRKATYFVIVQKHNSFVVFMAKLDVYFRENVQN